MFFMPTYRPRLELLLQLCAAYFTAFMVLFVLRCCVGPNPGWKLIVPVALLGAALGGIVSAGVGLYPFSPALLSFEAVIPHWQKGALFSAFFVGLSLVATAVKQTERAEFESRQRLLEARLQMLAARIEPHFLMNTLANLRYLVKSDSASAYKMLDHLSDFLQGALERSRDLRSTLGQELQIVESYLSIMQIRLGDKLSFTIDVPERLHALPFPSLLLQTLVENAITHGIAPLSGPGRVTITAADRGNVIELVVADDGVGFDPQRPPVNGVGLRNVRERLDGFYGGRAELRIAARRERGTEAIVTLPQGAA